MLTSLALAFSTREVSTLTKVFFFGVPFLLFAGMVALLLAGRSFARNRWPPGEGAKRMADGTAPIEAALFAVFGLLVAFCFSGALDRLDDRRHLIVDEANAIGTAYLRLDVLPAADRPALKEDLRRYVDSRIAYYRGLLDLHEAQREQENTLRLQREIWTRAVDAAARIPDSRATIVVLPAINEMIDLTTARAAAHNMHIAVAIFILLGVLALGCAFLAGTDMARSDRVSWLHVLAFAGTMALTAYVVLNLEWPRLGFVRFEKLDALLVQVRAEMI